MYYLLPEHSDLCKISWDISSEKFPDLEVMLRFINDLAERNSHIYLRVRGGDATKWECLVEFLKRLPEDIYPDVEVSVDNVKPIYWERFPLIYKVYTRFSFDKKLRSKLKYMVEVITHPEVELVGEGPAVQRLGKQLAKLGANVYGAYEANTPRHYPGGLIWEHEVISPQVLLDSYHNSFTGWKCRVGALRLHIDSNLMVHGGHCGTHFAGNLNQIGPIHILDRPVVCPHTYCSDYLDLTIEKWSPKLPTWPTEDIP